MQKDFSEEMPVPDKSKPNRPVSFRVLLLVTAVVLACVVFFLVTSGGDCIAAGKFKAWIDQNQNGVWDSSELPLKGVRFHIDDILNKYSDVGSEAVSDSNGQAEKIIWMPGCPWVIFQSYADTPPGYKFTTPSRVWDMNGHSFSFGFVQEP